jgi:hypothetical protein
VVPLLVLGVLQVLRRYHCHRLLRLPVLAVVLRMHLVQVVPVQQQQWQQQRLQQRRPQVVLVLVGSCYRSMMTISSMRLRAMGRQKLRQN